MITTYFAGFLFMAVFYDTLFSGKENWNGFKTLLMTALWPVTILFVAGNIVGIWASNECTKAGIEP